MVCPTGLEWQREWERDSARVRNISEKAWVTNLGDEWLKFGAFKVTLDGGMTIGTAYQRQPYGAFARQLYGLTDPADRGQLFVAPDKLLTIMRAARDKGWALTAHAQGGGAVDTLLETFEKLNTEKPIGPSRSHWIHASFQSPDAIARAKNRRARGRATGVAVLRWTGAREGFRARRHALLLSIAIVFECRDREEARSYAQAGISYLDAVAERNDAPPQYLTEAAGAHMEPPVPALVDNAKVVRYALHADKLTQGKDFATVFYLAQGYENLLDGPKAMEAI